MQVEQSSPMGKRPRDCGDGTGGAIRFPGDMPSVHLALPCPLLSLTAWAVTTKGFQGFTVKLLFLRHVEGQGGSALCCSR